LSQFVRKTAISFLRWHLVYDCRFDFWPSLLCPTRKKNSDKAEQTIIKQRDKINVPNSQFVK
jgi:hypothetical protein